MKVKLLPFEEARIKAREHKFPESSRSIVCIPKEKWNSEEIKNVTEDYDEEWVQEYFGYAYPKCCCEVIEK